MRQEERGAASGAAPERALDVGNCPHLFRFIVVGNCPHLDLSLDKGCGQLPTSFFGFIVVDGNGAMFAKLTGSSKEILYKF